MHTARLVIDLDLNMAQAHTSCAQIGTSVQFFFGGRGLEREPEWTRRLPCCESSQWSLLRVPEAP